MPPERPIDLRYEQDPMTSRECAARYRQSLEAGDDDVHLALIDYRAGREELDLGIEYAGSPDPLDRATGADILAQLGWGEPYRAWVPESVAILIPLLSDPDNRVVERAAVALGFRGDPAAIPHLIQHAAHPDPSVRYGVAHALASWNTTETVETLIHLANDPDRDVRDWAIFGLPESGPHFSQALPALLKALDDPHPIVRSQALEKLALAGHPGTLEAIARELLRPDVDFVTFEAAESLGDPQLLPLLEACRSQSPKDGSPYDHYLERAILRCREGGDNPRE
ncbi:HEAT repeat domain-containing protein [Luteolibacter sp. LG18]|uniref:HEAT repeat domain-containing protein n=1 Tax=Luteolibacter sp. LG18 TaxID=2819286 RepID=UPI002B2848A0|nr:hypothetical protein llg_08780 [Luteolibacter sp. LG18]